MRPAPGDCRGHSSAVVTHKGDQCLLCRRCPISYREGFRNCGITDRSYYEVLSMSRAIEPKQAWRTPTGDTRYVLAVREEPRANHGTPQRRVYWTRSERVVCAAEADPQSRHGMPCWEEQFLAWAEANCAEAVA